MKQAAGQGLTAAAGYVIMQSMDELVAAMEWREHETVRQAAYATGQAAERRRIRQAVTALKPPNMAYGAATWADRCALILAIIDGKA